MKERQTADLTGHSEMEMETRMFRRQFKVRPVLEFPAADPAQIRERQPVERAVPAQRHRPALGLQNRRRMRLERTAETRPESLRAADRTEMAADLRKRPSERREKADSPAVSGKAPTEGSHTENRRTRMFFSDAILRATQ